MGSPVVQPASRMRLYLAYATVSTVWGSTYLAIRVGVLQMPPFWMAGMRFLVAGIILTAYALVTGRRFPREAATWGWLILTGVLILGWSVGSMFWAEQHIDSGLAALLAGMSPVFMALYGMIGSEGDRLSPGIIMGLLVGLGGVAILVDPQTSGGTGISPLVPVVVILLGAQTWSGGSVLAKRRLKGVPPLVSAAVHSLAAGIFLILVDRAARGTVAVPQASPAAWGALAYLVIFGSVVTYSAYIYLVTHMAPAHAGTPNYINPVVAVFLGWLILDEPVTWRLLTGGLVILSGLWMVRRSRLEPRRSPPPTP